MELRSSKGKRGSKVQTLVRQYSSTGSSDSPPQTVDSPPQTVDSLVKQFHSKVNVSEMSGSVSEMLGSEVSTRYEHFQQVLSTREDLTAAIRQKSLNVLGEIQRNVPCMLTDSDTLSVDDCFQILKLGLPKTLVAEDNILVNLIVFLKKLQSSKASSSISSQGMSLSSTSSFVTSQERGLQMMAAICMPVALQDVRADEIWPKNLWLTGESPAVSMKQMLAVQQFEGCTFDLVDKGSCESVCGKGSKPDLVLKLKGHSAAVYCTGALICLHSGGAKARFDNLESISKAEDYGKRFLRIAGPSRHFIIVGVTELINIMWFKICTDGSVTRSVPTTKVKQSLCAFLIADPKELDVEMSGAELDMPKDWKWITTLGWGKTSIVHEFEHCNQKYAVKVAREAFKLDYDYAFLNLLKSVPGVPTCSQQLGNMLAIQPVGVPFTRANIEKHNLNFKFGQLIDILQLVHAKNFVNRDVRTENFMIAAYKGPYRFYIIDWGFACELGSRYPFAGSLLTASDNVLKQVQAGTDNGVVYEAADDLVALVRCIWLFCCGRLSTAIKERLGSEKLIDKQAQQLLSFWKDEMEVYTSWKLAHQYAIEGKIDCLKDWFRTIGEVM